MQSILVSVSIAYFKVSHFLSNYKIAYLTSTGVFHGWQY